MRRKVKAVGLAGVVQSSSFSTVAKLLETASYLCAIVTLIVIAFQLVRDSTDRRVSKSLEMVARYDTEPVSSYRAAIRDFEFAHRGELDEIDRNGGLSPADARVWISGRLKTYNTKFPERKVIPAILESASLFDQIATCEKRNICDSDVIRDFLGSAARDFHCTYGAIIRDQRRIFNRPDLGNGLALIVGDLPCTKI